MRTAVFGKVRESWWQKRFVGNIATWNDRQPKQGSSTILM
jgi:hypothetical protein